MRRSQSDRALDERADPVNEAMRGEGTARRENGFAVRHLEAGIARRRCFTDIPSKSEAMAPSCRICMEQDQTQVTGRLFAPCRCSGSIKYIHEQCLHKWMATSQKAGRRCPQCGMRYKVRVRRRKRALAFSCLQAVAAVGVVSLLNSGMGALLAFHGRCIMHKDPFQRWEAAVVGERLSQSVHALDWELVNLIPDQPQRSRSLNRNKGRSTPTPPPQPPPPHTSYWQTVHDMLLGKSRTEDGQDHRYYHCKRVSRPWDPLAAALYGASCLSGTVLLVTISVAVLTHQDWVLQLPGTLLHELLGVHEEVLWYVDIAMPFAWLGLQLWLLARFGVASFQPSRSWVGVVTWMAALIASLAIECHSLFLLVDSTLFFATGLHWGSPHLEVLDLDEWTRDKNRMKRYRHRRRVRKQRLREREQQRLKGLEGMR